MHEYCISFRIANRTCNELTYDERRQSLLDNARKENGGYWEETTSFILAESVLSTAAFTERVATDLCEEHDLLFIFDPVDMSACYFGALKHKDVLKSFFPKLTAIS